MTVRIGLVISGQALDPVVPDRAKLEGEVNIKPEKLEFRSALRRPSAKRPVEPAAVTFNLSL